MGLFVECKWPTGPGYAVVVMPSGVPEIHSDSPDGLAAGICDTLANVLTCANPANGDLSWRLRLKGPVSGSPVATKTHAFVFSEKGFGQVVDLTGKEGKVVSTIELDETILGTPAISGNALYVRSDAHLWKFGG